MKKTTSTILIALLSLFILSAGVLAQDDTNLTSLRVALWPEYDDPRLLVIIDGKLPAPGQTVQIPIPGNAEINAVATTDAGGGLINAAWTSSQDANGFVVVDLTSAGDAFRIEYYVPLTLAGDQRQVSFQLPAGYVAAETVAFEALLPPDATAVSTSPAMQSPGDANAPMLVRQSGPLTTQDSLQQGVSYSNPSGALTIPEDARPPAAQPAPQQAASQAAAASASSNANTIDPMILILGALALALIAGGGIWLWRMRETDAKPAPTPAPTQGTDRTAKPPANDGKGGDRFCRQCGTEFAGDDRFCRKCGAARR